MAVTNAEVLAEIASDLERELGGQSPAEVIREIVGRLSAYGMSTTAIQDALTGMDVETTSTVDPDTGMLCVNMQLTKIIYRDK